MNESCKEITLKTLDDFLSPFPTENPLFQIGNREIAITIKEALRQKIELLKAGLLENRQSPNDIWTAVLEELQAITEKQRISPGISVLLTCIVEETRKKIEELFPQAQQQEPAAPTNPRQEQQPSPPETVSGPITKGHPLHQFLIGQIIDTENEDLKKILIG